MTNSVLRNSDKDILWRKSSPLKLLWIGGCGRIACTGFTNLLISDWTGGVF